MSITQPPNGAQERESFLVSYFPGILPRIALRGIEAERCVKWMSKGLELMLIDGPEKMLFYLDRVCSTALERRLNERRTLL